MCSVDCQSESRGNCGPKSRRRDVSITKICCAAAVALAGVLGVASSPRNAVATSPPPALKANNQFFDWFDNTTPGYVGSPFLTDANRNAVNAMLQQTPAGRPLAVKIQSPISDTTANLIFNNTKYNVSYVFGDLETPNLDSELKTLVNQVQHGNSKGNGGKSNSFNAFIGNFGVQNLTNDFTMPNGYWTSTTNKNTHSFAGWDDDDFKASKATMSMPVLYPGGPSYRNIADGNASAANIRSSLFVLPALRVSQIKVNDPNTPIVPWAARFNNWGNLGLDTDRNPANGYAFVPGQPIQAKNGLPGFTAAQTMNQMLSRQDFAAQVAHYRLRGADSYVLFEPGVQGYLNDQKRADAKTGWTQPSLDAIFQASDHKLLLGKDTDYPPPSSGNLDPNENTIVDGVLKDDDKTGVMFSGVYSLSLKRMDILMSNMSDKDHTLTMPPTIGGFNLLNKSFEVDDGNHLLVEFKLTTSGVNKGWSVMTKTFPFMSLPNNRNETGIPEPANLTLLAMLAFVGVTPRRRRKQAAAENA